jgi:tetratricopeptide (TPR) repeat protein
MGNRIGEGFALGNLGWVTSMQGDFAQAQVYQEEALTVARETGNRYQEAFALINLSAMLVCQENYFDAYKNAHQALNLTRKIGDRTIEAWASTYLGHANLGLGNYPEAKAAYQEALEIRHALEQQSLAMEPLAGLAQTELEKGEPMGALVHVEKALLHLANGGNLDGVEEPLRIYLTVYLTLVANHDPRAGQILEDAHSLLQEQVNRIQNPKNRKMYVDNVPWRRQIEKLWQKKQRDT